MSADHAIAVLLHATAEQANNPALWRASRSPQVALLIHEIQRLHELIFKLPSWESRVCEVERELEAVQAALHRIGVSEAKLRYELGLVRGAFMTYATHRSPCFGVPCTCGFEHEQNRVRSGLLRNGVSA
jgi:hypothetical protein